MIKIFKLETRRNLTRLNLGIFLGFLLLGAVVTQIGIGKFQHEAGKKPEFTEVEAAKIKRYLNYTQYGIYGYRVLFSSSPLSVFFYNSTTVTDLEAFIDSAVRLKFNSPEIGENIFKRATGGFLDFSWLLLTIGSLLILVWGFQTLRPTDYIQFLREFAGFKQIHAGIILARSFLLSAATLIVFLGVFLQLNINGIHLSVHEWLHIAVFHLVFLGVMELALLTGIALGMINEAIVGGVIAAAIWLFFVFIYPEALNTLVEQKATNIRSRYQHEIEKLKILMEFEKEGYKKVQRYTNIKDAKKEEARLATSFWDNEFKRVEKLEEMMFAQLQKNTRFYQLLSCLNPVTFYKSVNNEISSKGFNAYLDFFLQCSEDRKGFVRFYIEKKYYSNYSKIESFTKNGENIKESTPSLPNYFIPGILLILLYCGILAAIIHRLHPKKFLTTSNIKPKIKETPKDTFIFIHCPKEKIIDDIFHFYQNKPNTLCLDKINPEHFYLDLSPTQLLDHLTNIAGASKEKVMEHLDIMNTEIPPTTTENFILKLYLAVMTAKDFDTLVLKEYVKNRDQSLEDDIVPLLQKLEMENKRVRYLSTQLFNSKGEEHIGHDNQDPYDYRGFPLPLSRIALR